MPLEPSTTNTIPPTPPLIAKTAGSPINIPVINPPPDQKQLDAINAEITDSHTTDDGLLILSTAELKSDDKSIIESPLIIALARLFSLVTIRV